MADSEEEFERRRRDKFRRERNDYQDRREPRNRGEEWEERPRENWRGGRIRKESNRGDYERRKRYGDREYSPHGPAQMKRVRRDWDDTYYPNTGPNINYHHPGNHPPYSNWHDYQLPPTLPPMPIPTAMVHREANESGASLLNFKQFLLQQEDTIDVEEAVKKYKEYKIEFQKHAINEFFNAHKLEEWFKNKYHPEDKINVKQDKEEKVKNRLKIFMEFYENGWVDKISLNQSQLKEIIKFMDAVIIKLEGGTDSDLKYLEEEYASAIVLPEEINILDHNLNSKQLANNSTNNHISNLTINGCNDIGDDDMEDIDRLDFEIEGEQQPLGEGVVVKTGNDKRNDVTSKNDMDKEKVHGKGTKSHKNKTKKSCCSSISRSSSCCSGSSRSSRSGSSSGSSSRSGSSSSSGHSSANSKKKLSEKAIATEGVNKSPIEEGEAKDDDEDKKIMVPNITDESSPKPFHKTTSIFLRNLPPNITKTEIENLCKSYNGYLRVALADPLPERKFYRRGWVTFNNKDANVKEICSTLATIKIRDCEMGPIVNRDITRRVRLVNGIVVHKPLAKSDVRLSLKIVVSLDKKYNLWNNEETTNKETSLEKEPQNDLNIANSISSDPFEIDEELADIMNMMDKSLLEQPEVLKKIIMKVKNPIIKSIVEELMKISLVPVDEIPLVDDKNEINDDSVIKTLPINDVIRSVDHKDATPNNDFDQDHTECDKNKETLECDKNKEDKTGKDNEIETNVNSVEKIVTLVEKDENINKLLDKLILYLRVVHSLDYYSVSEYPNEDDMPNKCGIIHCRGSLSQTKILSKDIQDWLKNFENKIQTFLSSNNHVTKEEASLLGFKDYETEVEKFVQENTQELSKDKWLCPLSGKKFKGPDFVRKHIFNKHHDKVEQVKKEVDFFNNYLLDPKRPHNIDILGYVSSSNAIIANNSANSTTNNVNAKLPTKPFNNFHPYPPNQPHIYQDYPGKNYYYPPPPYSARPGIDSFERNQFMKRKGPGMQREIIQYRDLDAPEDNETLY